MKVYTPEISWHERDPIYTCHFHPKLKNKIATSGVTGVIRLWEIGEKVEDLKDAKVIKTKESFNNSIGNKTECKVKFIASLKRHCKSVNVVRWNSSGDVLASAGDEAVVFLWKENEVKNQKTLDMDEDENKENWFSFKTFRGHLEDILDISWSVDSSLLISGSIDNSVMVWDVSTGSKIAILKEPKGFVQGVAYDPLGMIYCCLSTDRCLRIYSSNNNKCVNNISKIQMSKENVDPMPPTIRIFHDDTMKSFFRRMCFSKDGNLLFVPSGCLEIDNKQINSSYIFTRNSYVKPCLYIPHDRPSIAIACCPLEFQLNSKRNNDGTEVQNIFSLPYRYIFAIATEDSVYIYDTQNILPFCYATGIHYSNLSDLSWSQDGKILSVTSIDGFCSFIIFKDGELGDIFKEPILNNLETDIYNQENVKPRENSDIKLQLKKQSINLETNVSKDKTNEQNICEKIVTEKCEKKPTTKAKNSMIEKSSSIEIVGSNSIKKIKLFPLGT